MSGSVAKDGPAKGDVLAMIVRDGALRAGWQSMASEVGRVGQCDEVRGNFESDQEIQIRTIDVFLILYCIPSCYIKLR